MKQVLMSLACAGMLPAVTAFASQNKLSISDITTVVPEGRTATFTVRLTAPDTLVRPVTVHWTTQDLTAHAGSDYHATSGDLSFPSAGEQVVQVETVEDSTLAEGSEVFFVKLETANGADIEDGLGTGVVRDAETTPVVCDLNGNGHTELVATHHASTGGTLGPPVIHHDWDLDGPLGGEGGGPLVPVAVMPEPWGWDNIAMNDFDGNGTCDIVWQLQGSSQLTLMPTPPGAAPQPPQPGNLLGLPHPGSSWRLLGTGHFSGPAQADLLWWNATTRYLQLWAMPDISVQDLRVKNAAVGEPIAVMRLDGAPLSGILWRQASGALTYWRMDGLTVVSTSPVAYPANTHVDLSWRAAAVGDFDGDGGDDLVWQGPGSEPTAGGRVALWFMRAGYQANESLLIPEWLLPASASFLPGIVDGPR